MPVLVSTHDDDKYFIWQASVGEFGNWANSKYNELNTLWEYSPSMVNVPVGFGAVCGHIWQESHASSMN
jgi:hypothetical protein